MTTKEDLEVIINGRIKNFLNIAKIGDIITAYEKGIHEYLGVERAWIVTEEALERIKKEHITPENIEQWDKFGHTEQNIKYFSNRESFSIAGAETIPIDTNSWHFEYYRKEYGLKKEDYCLAPLKGNEQVVVYRRLYSSKLKPSKGAIRTCSAAYCKLFGDGSREYLEKFIADNAKTLQNINRELRRM